MNFVPLELHFLK